ncbi:hypothetical protein [Methylobrevis pamukkalensis]|uniref:Uncharacterized protein n=1 Tax=Methylobrevis pamukkalensis TaxID=1439726 RepID=A0A1E3H7Y6_9HYPH|nr:hypothetical protein [Methylobrevis pamukkalensis]ODN72414.1 hypothetical protein A6302_00160 [Methylobrevis pamukkalensis]
MGLVIEFGVASPRLARRHKSALPGEVMIFPGVRVERHGERDSSDGGKRRTDSWQRPRWNDLDD